MPRKKAAKKKVAKKTAKKAAKKKVVKKTARKRRSLIKEFRKTAKSGKTRIWHVEVAGDEVTISHYWEGSDKVQETSRRGEAKNIGRANEVTPEVDAKNWAKRQIELKVREGYREWNIKEGEFYQHEDKSKKNSIDFNNLPRELRFYKPQNNLNAHLKKLLESWEAVATRKRDGVMAAYVIDSKGRHRIYSSSMATTQKDEKIELILRYPDIELAMKSLTGNGVSYVPTNTIFLGEICCVAAGGYFDENRFDVDDLDLVNGVRGGLTDSALKLQQEHGPLGFCIWDIAFWGKDCLMHSVPTIDRLMKIVNLVKKEETGFLTHPEICMLSKDSNILEVYSPAGEFHINPDFELGQTFEELLLDFAKDYDWEGWVIVDPNATYGEKAYNFRGKAERPKECAKLKPLLEADFVVRWDPDGTLGGGKIGKRGKGKKSSGVGSVQAYLIHKDGREVPVGLVGGGLEDEDVIRFADPSIYPLVWQVEFASWTKTGSLQFARFARVRDDKTPIECSVEQNPDWERHYAD